MIKVVSFKICPFVQRVTAILEAKKIPYEIEYINLNNPPPWFTEVSPNAQVPLMIVENNIVLFESNAISEYLDDKYPALESNVTAEQKATDRAWIYQATKHYLTQCGAMTSPNEQTLTARAKNLSKAFARIEQVIDDNGYYREKNTGNVDIAWLPLLHRAYIIKQKTGYDFLDGYPKTQKWQNSLMQTGLAEKAVAADFDKVFTSFYLSDKTYLGKGEDCDSSDESCADNNCCG